MFLVSSVADTKTGNSRPMPLFVRLATNPAADLKRGYSYTSGAFEDEDQAHAGLSCYSLDELTLDDAIRTLDNRLGVVGAARDGSARYVVVLDGRRVGEGPEGEPLVRPRANIAKVACKSVKTVEAMIAAVEKKILAAGHQVCAAQSTIQGGRFYCYCTLRRGHEGEHVAETQDRKVIARWPPGPKPESL